VIVDDPTQVGVEHYFWSFLQRARGWRPPAGERPNVNLGLVVEMGTVGQGAVAF